MLYTNTYTNNDIVQSIFVVFQIKKKNSFLLLAYLFSFSIFILYTIQYHLYMHFQRIEFSHFHNIVFMVFLILRCLFEYMY